MRFMTTTVDYPKYNMLSNERAVLSALLSEKSKCSILKNGKINTNLSLSNECLGVYREGLSEGSVNGYVLSVKDQDGVVVKEWSEVMSPYDEQYNVFISSRYFPYNGTVYKISLEVYTRG